MLCVHRSPVREPFVDYVDVDADACQSEFIRKVSGS